MSADSSPGFYGKLPSHGDFLKRRVSDQFVAVWDLWLRECVASSQGALGERWEAVYMTSPVWRFAAVSGACGPAPIVGVMAPSVDRVGRHFPLVIVAPVAESADPFRAATAGRRFFDSAERLLLETFDLETIDLEQFDRRVMELAGTLDTLGAARPLTLDSRAADVLGDGLAFGWHVPIGSTSRVSGVLEQILAARLSELYRPLVVWWTEGSAEVEPCCLLVRGLPAPDTFAALLDGAWTACGWPSVSATVDVAAALDDTAELAMPAPSFRSAAESHVGLVRKINQDSLIERTEVGLWSVADGLGGLSEGEVASRMVCDTLADFVPVASFDEVLESVHRRLDDVNAQLSRNAAREINPVESSSTVVVLLTRGTRCAVLWAGDSRAYRWRAGVLEQLTSDHSASEGDGGTSTAITRAVGAEATLALDVLRDRVLPGDRFLLCSDGLTRAVSDAAIGALMSPPDLHEAVHQLVQAALAAGGPDNVTALIVEARA